MVLIISQLSGNFKLVYLFYLEKFIVILSYLSPHLIYEVIVVYS